MREFEGHDGEIDLAICIGLRGSGRREDRDASAVRDVDERVDGADLGSVGVVVVNNTDNVGRKLALG